MYEPHQKLKVQGNNYHCHLQIRSQQPMVYAVVRHPYERLVSSYLDFGQPHFFVGFGDDSLASWSLWWQWMVSGEMTGGHNGGIAEGTFAQFLTDTVPKWSITSESSLSATNIENNLVSAIFLIDLSAKKDCAGFKRGWRMQQGPVLPRCHITSPQQPWLWCSSGGSSLYNHVL